jgi:uncharacterized protein (TIGR03086 family)
MSEFSERYRKVAGRFTERVNGVPEGAWDNPAPCEGWVARDILRHLCEWVPGYFESNVGIDLPKATMVDEDPGPAWTALSDAIQAVLDDPEMAGREFEGRMGRQTVEQSIDMIVTGDVLLHTWDLARATGQDETLDPDEVHRMFEGMEPMDELLRTSGHYGPRVEVPDDADEQTKLIAFIGRRP